MNKNTTAEKYRFLKLAVGVVAVVAVLALGLSWINSNRLASRVPGNPDYHPPVVSGGGSGGTACTQEAKICPDGSTVGRTGPNCEFSECPKLTAEALQKINFAGHYRGVVGADSLELKLEQVSTFVTGAYCAKSQSGGQDCDSKLQIQPVANGGLTAPVQGYVSGTDGFVTLNVRSYKVGQSSMVRMSKDGEQLVWKVVKLGEGVTSLPSELRLQLVK